MEIEPDYNNEDDIQTLNPSKTTGDGKRPKYNHLKIWICQVLFLV